MFLRYLVPITHVIVWISLFFYPFLFHYVPINDGWAVTRIALFLLLLIGFFYSNTYLLIPRILSKGRSLLYLLSVAGCIALISFAAGYIQAFFNPQYNYRPEIFDRSFNTGIVTGILAWIISTGIKVTTEWIRNQQMIRTIENERLNSELNFLKSQVNPHFLFNALNNIYALENRKSPDTGAAILKLSELIRYMIYETSTELVPLEKEIVYLENYVALQKMSLSKEVELTCTVTGDPAGKLIEPMLLIPLVENVFKHGITYRHPVKVSIQINITGNVIELVTRNPLTENRFPDTERKGIGLVNLKKRLNLHYRGKHELQTGIEDKDFITHLKIWLE